MTFHPSPADDAGQSDDLNAFLDAIARGEADAPDALNPMLAGDIRHIHHLADASVAESTRRADKAQRWEHLMQRHRLRTSTPNVMTNVTLPVSSPVRPMPRTVRSRRRSRWHGRPMGVFATVLLVALIALSGTAAYLAAPRAGDAPTQLPAGSGPLSPAQATPQATPDGVPSDLSRVTASECTVQARSFDAVMATITGRRNDVLGKSGTQTYNRNPDPTFGAVVQLPDGTGVDQSDIDTLSNRFGQFLGCPNPLRAAQFFTDAGLVRYYWSGGSALSGPGFVSERYQDLWLDSQGQFANGDQFSFSAPIGQPGLWYLYGFRHLENGRIGAYITQNTTGDANARPRFPDPSPGLIVFALQGADQWKIDEILLPPLG